MNDFHRLCLALAAVAVALSAWLARYTIVMHDGGPTTAYKLDRWTGKVEFLHTEESYPVKPAKP